MRDARVAVGMLSTGNTILAATLLFTVVEIFRDVLLGSTTCVVDDEFDAFLELSLLLLLGLVNDAVFRAPLAISCNL